jgi:ribosomal-protein-alanine N-acetyltransferase
MAEWHIELLSRLQQIDDVIAIEHVSFTSPWTREMYVAEFQNRDISYCYLAKSDAGETVGFCSFWRVLDELHINNLAVAPSYRRSGVATALLTRVLDDGAQLGAVRATLEVRRSNDTARLLYERLGFSVVGVRQGYYTRPVEDAIVLRREALSADR